MADIDPAKPRAVTLHIVRPGESLASIAQDHGVTLPAVLNANRQITQPNLIRPGQTVHLPAGAHAHGRASGAHRPAGAPGATHGGRPAPHHAAPSPKPRAAAPANGPSPAPGVSAAGFDFIYHGEHVDGISERFHWPKGASGVTLGSGYDMRYRKPDQIVRELTEVGLSTAQAQVASRAAGLSGEEARTFVAENRDAVHLTDRQEKALLVRSLRPVVETVRREVTVPLTQNQRDALTSLVYNIGEPRFRNSEVRRRINQQDYSGAAEAFHMWRKSGGSVSKVLVERRRLEVALFNRAATPGPPATLPTAPARGGVPLRHMNAPAGGASGGNRFADIVRTRGDASAQAALAAGELVIVGLRTPTAYDSNRGRGTYDDAMVIVHQVAGSIDSATFRCNTEPSAQYVNHADRSKRPPDANRDGVGDLGVLMTGQTIHYVMGTFLKAAALKIDQSRSYRVGRDTNHDNRHGGNDPVSMVPAAGGMHIHIGGATNTWSMGCQTLPPTEHARFFATLRRWAPQQRSFYYVLVDGAA
ncbi:glycoside hydrolase family protein [Sphingomonas montana]|uniref:glycoside hydrolase family protein n=1 Tax=Sphingomonas montana TaxID=1843236 RepID=UPI00096BE579|nr:glycoside hydrolase family protein [Sphingomonas montana]